MLTPTAETQDSASELVAAIARSVGAEVLTLEPAEHDAAVASVSFLS